MEPRRKLMILFGVGVSAGIICIGVGLGLPGLIPLVAVGGAIIVASFGMFQSSLGNNCRRRQPPAAEAPTEEANPSPNYQVPPPSPVQGLIRSESADLEPRRTKHVHWTYSTVNEAGLHVHESHDRVVEQESSSNTLTLSL